MKAVALWVAAALVAPLAMSRAGELDTLRQRCAEQERQIQELETENARLRSQLEGDPADPGASAAAGTESTATSVPEPTTVAARGEAAAAPVTQAAPASPAPPASKPSAAGTVIHTVKPGETLIKIARRYSTTPEAISKANRIKDPSVVPVGMKLTIPGGSPAPAANANTPATGTAPRSHTVANRETLYGIARKYGTTVQAILDANPGIDPTSLQIGQKLTLPAKGAVPPKTTVPGNSSPPAAPLTSPDRQEPAPLTGQTGSSAAKPKPGAGASDTPPVAGPLPATASTIRKVTIDEEITFGEFAAKHGTSPEKINDLNGLTISNSTTLAKGSELYVPAAP